MENRSTQFHGSNLTRESFDGRLPAYPLERIMIFGFALNAMASPADTIGASLFISEHQADG